MKISVLPWDEAKKLLPANKDVHNIEFLDILTEIGNILHDSKKDYVYHLKLNFGDKIIDKGVIFLGDKPYLEACLGYTLNMENFKKDILYSNDPLGVVLTNQIEVFTENKSRGQNGCMYTFPLNTLESGDLFGVYGALDYFSGIKKNILNREWYVRAGIISYGIAFPFHNNYETSLLVDGQKHAHLSGKHEKIEQTPGDNKVNFIKEFIDDWHVDIVYIPKHFFENTVISDELMFKIKKMLYEIGWKQSAPMRNVLFKDTFVYNLISKSTYKTKHSNNLLIILYDYLFNALRGNTLVMKPLLETDHIINKAILGFKRKNKNYFSSDKCKEPLPFIFSKINRDKENDWGIISVYNLPIIYNYEIKSLNNLLKDLEIINLSIRNDRSTKKDYQLPHLYGYGNTGGSKESKVEPMRNIFKLIGDTFDIDKDRINMSSREFTNLLFIKNEKS